MIFKKDELRILWPFYLTDLIYGLSMIIFPFMMIYFRNLGLSFFQISILVGAYGIASFLFEIPTGAFADGFSRKYSSLLGLFMGGVSLLLFAFTTNFYVMLLLWFLAGLSMTFVSGAFESWVVDNLKEHKRKELQQEYFIKNYSLSSIGMIVAPLIGAFIIKNYSQSILWIVSGFGFLIGAFILSLFAEELYKPKRLSVIKSLKNTWDNSKKGLKFSFSHRQVMLIILGSVFVGMLLLGETGWQPLMVSLSMPQYSLGFVYSIVAVGWVLGPFVPKLFGKINVKKTVIIVTAFRMLLLFSVVLVHKPFFIIVAAILVFDQFFKAMSDPLLLSYIHKFIPTRIRATVISIKSMLLQVVFALTGLIAGVLQDAIGPAAVISIGGLFGFFAIATFLKLKD